MRISDLNYLSEVTGIDPDLVGGLLNQGVHHRVYEYGQEQVIKVPRRRFNFLYTERAHLEADLKLINHQFPNLTIKTEVLSSADHSRHCLIQERIHDYRLLTPRNFAQHRTQFNQLWEANQELIQKSGYSLDFVGGEGIFSCFSSLLPAGDPPFFSNLVIDERGRQPQLKLIDTELLRLGKPSLNPTDLFRSYLSWVSWFSTLLCLRWFFAFR